MARYSDFLYQTRQYGQAPRALPLSFIEATALDFNKIRVSIDMPNRYGYDYVICRSVNGAAEDPTDGLTVKSGRVQTTQFSFEDDPNPGLVYYTIFVFDEKGQWLKDAATSVISPQDRNGYLKTLQAIPRMYLADDLNPLTPFNAETFMARFLYGIGLTIDELGTFTDLVLPESRSAQGVRDMAHGWASGVGFRPETEIGTASSFRLYRDSGLIYSQKGRATGLIAYAEALTGWSVSMSRYENLIPTLNDASFETSSGNWELQNLNFEVVSIENNDNPLYELVYDYPTSRFAREGAGRFTLTSSDSEMLLSPLIPIQDIRLYVFKVPAKAVLGTPNLTLSILWCDNRGNVLDTLSSSPDTLTEGEYATLSISGQAPENTRFARLKIDINGDSGDEFDLDRLSFMDADGPYRDPNTVTLICAPDRVNLLSDPSFEIGGFWTEVDGTFETNQEAALRGEFGASLAGEPYLLQSEAIPALPGYSLVLSGHARGSGICKPSIHYYDTSGNLVSSTSTSITLTQDFERFDVVSKVPDGSETLKVSIAGAGTAYLDLLTLDRQERPQVYFDGMVSNANQDDSRYAIYDGHFYSVLYNNRLSKLIRLKQSLEDFLPLGVTPRIVFWDSQDDEVQNILPYGVSLDGIGPDAPQNLFALPGDERIFVSFTAGEYVGDLINYSYSVDNGVTWVDRYPPSTATEFTIFGTPSSDLGTERRIKYSELDGYVDYADLASANETYLDMAGLVDVPLNAIVNGNTYYVRVRALTDQGYSSPSGVAVVTPRGLPGKPIITSVTEGDGTASVYFKNGSSNGATVTSHQYSLDAGDTWELYLGASPIVLTGLNNGQSYSIIIRSNTDDDQNSQESLPATFIPRTVSDAPAISSLTPGNQSILISFTGPNFNGGREITNYEFSLNGGTDWIACSPTITTSPILVQGLTNGQEYPVRLRAVTSIGSGAASNSVSATPVTTPGAPSITRIIGSDQAVSVSFAVSNTGGSPITNIEYSIDGSTWVTRNPASATSPITITGLTNGVDYPVRIRTINAQGTGPSSSQVIGRPVSIPNPPVGLAASPGSQIVELTWTAPDNNGGQEIDFYTVDVQPSVGTVTYPIDRSETGASITGLVNGTKYAFSVRAVNRAGLTGPSAMVESTPRTSPSAPTILSGTRGNSRVLLTWNPASDGGSPVTNYRVRYSSNAGSTWSSGTLTGSASNSFNVTGLAGGASYLFQVRAVNVAGESPYSSAFGPIVAAEAPLPPDSLTLTPGDETITVSWTAPANSSVSGASSYVVEYSLDSGTTWTTWTTTSSTSTTITGLVNGTPLRVRVAAINMDGVGSFETSDPVTPASIPHPPIINSVSVSNGNATVYFTLNPNGSPITNVQYSLSTTPNTFNWSNFNPQTISSPAVIQGLSNGVTYYIALRATNAIGTSTASLVVSTRSVGLPTAPTITGVTSGGFTFPYLGRTYRKYSTSISFTAPSSNGGSAITGYDVSIDGGSSVWASTTSTSSPITFSTAIGTGRPVRIRAKTALGAGAWSAPYTS